jgi:hypothetical protein
MNVLAFRNVLIASIGLVLSAMAWPLTGCAAQAAELELRSIDVKPEPLGQLHPKLRWMTRDKVRGIWITDDLFDKSVEGDKTKAQVIADAGFNLVIVEMNPNTDNTRSTVVDTSKPYELKHDRTKSTDLETRLAGNVAEAHRVGLSLFIGWKYGTHHLEPYRKYRSPTKGVATYTCCPLDEAYIAGQHIGKWAVKVAQGGADGINIDTEMYYSDTSSYRAPCVCDDCFATYLKEYATDWEAVYDRVPADERGQWLVDRKALNSLESTWRSSSSHYALFATKRVEELWDRIRVKCQAINPAFVLARYHVFDDLPGMERGMGTSSVPCLMFNSNEYPHGAYRSSFQRMNRIADDFPVLYLPGMFIHVQPLETLAKNALQASLYTDGWWVWYGNALLTDGLPGHYGRFGTTSRSECLDRIKAVHAEIDELLTLPRNQWPKRQDGKLNWLKAKVDKAEAEAAKSPSAETAKALAEAKTDFENYMKLVRKGGY